VHDRVVSLAELLLADGADPGYGFVSTTGRPELYEAEQSAAGPARTVVAFNPGTLHRGTGLTAHRGARYSMHLSYRPARADWGQRTGWAGRSHEAAWYQFVSKATPRQLRLFGFPRPATGSGPPNPPAPCSCATPAPTGPPGSPKAPHPRSNTRSNNSAPTSR